VSIIDNGQYFASNWAVCRIEMDSDCAGIEGINEDV
jgi:hypothetical protein